MGIINRLNLIIWPHEDDFKSDMHEPESICGDRGQKTIFSLAAGKEKRLLAYRELFSECLNNSHIHKIRNVLNQELVLGNDCLSKK